MTKWNPGKWEPEGEKPTEFAISGSSAALDRIKNQTSDMAFQVAAQRAQAAGLPYGDSGVVNSQVPGPGAGGMSRIQANFDNIVDDYQYRVAQALYQAGQPEERIQLGNGTVAELYTNDLAILYVTGGRSMDHVDIQTFRSVRGLDGAWDDLLTEAGY